MKKCTKCNSKEIIEYEQEINYYENGILISTKKCAGPGGFKCKKNGYKKGDF